MESLFTEIDHVAIAVNKFTKARCPISTPLGFPVDPDV